VVGYNASGKTNLGRAMMDIINNLTDKALREAHNLQKMYRAGAFHE